MNKELKKAIEYIADNMDLNMYDTLCDEYYKNEEIQDGKKENQLIRSEIVNLTIEDFFNYTELEKMEELNIENMRYLITAWADGQVDIYNYNLYEKSAIFASYTEGALSEYGYDEKRGFIGILLVGQYFFYEQLGNEILAQLEKYLSIEQ